MCPHEHIAKMLADNKESESESVNGKSSGVNQEHVWLEKTSKYLYENAKIDFDDSNISRLEKEIMFKSNEKKWSKVYQVRIKVFINHQN